MFDRREDQLKPFEPFTADECKITLTILPEWSNGTYRRNFDKTHLISFVKWLEWLMNGYRTCQTYCVGLLHFPSIPDVSSSFDKQANLQVCSCHSLISLTLGVKILELEEIDFGGTRLYMNELMVFRSGPSSFPFFVYFL